MKNYLRVIPRDLFNEANLLKCLGKIIIAIENNQIDLSYEHDNEAFNICQDEGDGAIYVSNIEFWLNEKPINFVNPLNTREKWPLLTIIDDEYINVFKETGEFTAEFLRKSKERDL